MHQMPRLQEAHATGMERRTGRRNTTKVAAGELRLSGWWFDISNGVTHAHERESRSFADIDHELADRMIARLGEA
jgi:hypothetical protein